MAEGDTILRAARRIEAALGGEEIEASAPSPRGRAAGIERLSGHRLESVEARGKNLLLRFGDLALHSHLGMNGSWHVYRPGERWRKPRRAAWVRLAGKHAEAVQFGGPTLRVIAARTIGRDPKLARLGPDVLAPDFDAGAATSSLRATDPSRGLGDVLLDQERIAGIGNIFKSEACFEARFDPWHPIGETSDADLERVLLAARRLMLDAVAEGRGQRGVYKRAGQPCPVCGTTVRSRGQGDDNRTTYWCPSCQGERSVMPGRDG